MNLKYKQILLCISALTFSVIAHNTFAAAPAMGCGNVTSTGSGNTTPLVIDGFPCAGGGDAGYNNAPMEPFISVKLCTPGSTSDCAIIDHVIADTGSSGLRVAASALPSNLKIGSATGLKTIPGSASGTILTECETYVDSFVYGPVVKADLYIADEFVKNVDIQVFGDSKYKVARDCKKQGGADTNTTADFGGNGLLGVGFWLADDYALYYDCKTSKTSSCNANKTYKGIPNPAALFAMDNNGVAISLPAVDAKGSTTPVVGTLTFGISTQSNNTPPANAIALNNLKNPNSDLDGTFNTQVGGNWFGAYIDSGTDVVYFNDKSNSKLKTCTSDKYFEVWYCPGGTITENFVLAHTGSQTAVSNLNISIADADKVALDPVVAYNNVAGPDDSSATSGGAVGFGLSVFLGHSIYSLYNDRTAPGVGLGGTAGSTVTGPINAIS